MESPTKNPSSKLYYPSPKRKRLLSNSSTDEEFKTTEIRGRKYLLSPQKSPSKHKPNQQATGPAKRPISLSVSEQARTDVESHSEKVTSLPRKRAPAARHKRQKKDSEVDLIDSYGSETEQEHQSQKRQKSTRCVTCLRQGTQPHVPKSGLFVL